MTLPTVQVSFTRKYGKALVAVAIAAVTALQAALSDHHLTPQEVVQVATAFATAVGVYLIPTAPGWKWGKTAVAVVISVLGALSTLVVNGPHSGDWTGIILAALMVLAVGAAPAVSVGAVIAEPPGEDGNPLT